jgi:hypothetical protein
MYAYIYRSVVISINLSIYLVGSIFSITMNRTHIHSANCKASYPFLCSTVLQSARALAIGAKSRWPGKSSESPLGSGQSRDITRAYTAVIRLSGRLHRRPSCAYEGRLGGVFKTNDQIKEFQRQCERPLSMRRITAVYIY